MSHKPNEDIAVTIKTKIIDHAASQVFTSAAEIVNDVLQQDLQDVPVPTLAAPANVIWAANCHRQAMHPEEPTTLDFQLAIDSIPPGFLWHDIIFDDCWHVILATDKIILLLSGSKNWYADGTFDVVQKPFTQLFSIHAFMRSDSCIKQVPLMFVIMSGKRKRDYKKGFVSNQITLAQLCTENHYTGFWSCHVASSIRCLP